MRRPRRSSPRAASSSQEAASTTPISAEGAPRRKRPLDRATAAHLQIPALLPARRIPARTARTKTRRHTHPIRPATCAGSRVCGPALSFANPNRSDEPASAPDVSPACENRSTCIRRGPHARQRRVACTPLPGRMNGNAGLYAPPRRVAYAASPRQFQLLGTSAAYEKVSLRRPKETAGRWLAFSHFRARYSASPQSSAQKLKACSACFSQEAFRALSRTI